MLDQMLDAVVFADAYINTLAEHYPDRYARGQNFRGEIGVYVITRKKFMTFREIYRSWWDIDR